MSDGGLRVANLDDRGEILSLWARLFEVANPERESWYVSAGEWFTRWVDDEACVRFPVVELHGAIVSTAIGTLELGAPNPHCLHGRTVRLANLFTLPEHRGSGHGTRLVEDVIGWARSIGADRVDLSATPQGRSLYEQLGFTHTTAPRMKLVLGP